MSFSRKLSARPANHHPQPRDGRASAPSQKVPTTKAVRDKGGLERLAESAVPRASPCRFGRSAAVPHPPHARRAHLLGEQRIASARLRASRSPRVAPPSRSKAESARAYRPGARGSRKTCRRATRRSPQLSGDSSRCLLARQTCRTDASQHIADGTRSSRALPSVRTSGVSPTRARA